MKNLTQNDTNGFSIIELLIIITVMGILVVIAVIQVGSASVDFDRQKIAKQLKVYLEKAKFDSVKRSPRTLNEMSNVTITSPTSFSVQTDLNMNGTLEAFEIQQANLDEIRIKDTGWNFPLIVRFDKNGHTIATDSLNNLISPNFEICEDSCSAHTSTAENANVISVSPTGTVILLKGGDALPTYTSPTVTSVTPTSDVDPMVSTQ